MELVKFKAPEDTGTRGIAPSFQPIFPIEALRGTDLLRVLETGRPIIKTKEGDEKILELNK